jgi:hypothetical protein
LPKLIGVLMQGGLEIQKDLVQVASGRGNGAGTEFADEVFE